MGKVLGVDIGIASVGLAVVDEEYHVLEAVSDIFPAAEAQKNVDRRGFRQGRRLKRRQRTRIYDFGKMWDSYGLPIPDESQCDVLQKRVEGLSKEISLEDMYAVLLNNLKHRGISYLEDAIDETNKSSQFEASLARNQRELETKYPCEIQLERLEKYGVYRGENVVTENGEKITISNVFTMSAYRREVEKLFETQQRYHSCITDEVKESYLAIFDRKREYYEGPGNEKSRTDYGRYTTQKDENGKYITEDNIFEKLIGTCSIYKDKQRAAGASYTAQEFNVLNDLNNLIINGRKLEKEEKEQIVADIKTATSVNMRKIISAAMNEKIVSLEGARIDKNDKEEFHKFDAYRAMKKALSEKSLDIDSFTREQLDTIGHVLTLNTDRESIVKALNGEGIVDENLQDTLIALRKKNGSMFSKWQSFSLDIMEELIPEMYEQPKNQMVLLSEMGLIKSNREFYKGKKYIPAEKILEETYNPVVKKSSQVAINAINALLKKYGEFDQIVIEMPRDKNSDEEKKRIDSANKNNEKELDDIIQKIKNEYGRSITKQDFWNHKKLVLKLKLWNEQQGKCLYSGRAIDINDLVDKQEMFEIDHAIPQSISFDDSRTNKVLVYRSENQQKGNETPYMYLKRINHTDWNYEQYKAYVLGLNFNRAKKEKLLFEKDINKIEVLQGFIQRNLNDTRYSSRVVLNVLQSFFGANDSKTKIKVIRGSFTHQMRENLKLDKNRDESYSHHAVDAMLIAYSQLGYDAYHKLQGEVIDFETGEILDKARLQDVVSEDNYKKFLYEDKMLEIRKGIKIAENTVKYWYMVDKKCNRALCDQTIYGTREFDGKAYKISKTKSIYTKQGLDALKKRIDKPESFLMYRNDPKTWEALVSIYAKYSDAANPFVEYEKETGDYLRKYSKDHNGPRIETLRYVDGEVGSCIDISHKYGYEKGSKKVVLDSLKPYRTDVYRNVNTGNYALIGIKQSGVKVSGKKYVLDMDVYDDVLRKDGLIADTQTYKDMKNNGYEFVMSFYKNEIIEFEKDGEIVTARFLSKSESAKNRVEIMPIDKPKYEKRVMPVLTKTKFIRKVRTDILGNRFCCVKEEFRLEC